MAAVMRGAGGRWLGKRLPAPALLWMLAAMAAAFVAGYHSAPASHSCSTLQLNDSAHQPNGSGAASCDCGAEVDAAMATHLAAVQAGGAAEPAAQASSSPPPQPEQQQQQQQEQRQQRLAGPDGPPPYDPATLGLAAARAAAAAKAVAPTPQARVIPRFLHRVYIADQSDETRRNFTMPVAHRPWVESCQQHHPPRAGWTYFFWDHQAAEALIANHYPAFLPFYKGNASRAIERSDLVRYAILHRMGGLYLDSDIECWRESGDMLAGFDFVAQATHAAEGTTNAAIAARPGLPVFLKALELVQGRRVDTRANPINVIARTGPNLLADALEAVGVKRGADGMFQKRYELNGDVYRLWRVGAWFHPCQWWEEACRRAVYVQRAEGRASMWRLAGFHRMVGSWIPGKEDGIGILNVTAEICGTADHERGNGRIGGWVAPKRRQQPAGGGPAGRRRRRLE